MWQALKKVWHLSWVWTAPSSKLSAIHDCPFLNVNEREEAKFAFAEEDEESPPRNLAEWLLPFPPTCGAFEFAIIDASAESLVLRRGPESENNLPETWKVFLS